MFLYAMLRNPYQILRIKISLQTVLCMIVYITVPTTYLHGQQIILSNCLSIIVKVKILCSLAPKGDNVDSFGTIYRNEV